MELIDVLLITFLSIILILNLIYLFSIDKFKKDFYKSQQLSQSTPTPDEQFDKRELTSYELERLEREEEFDSRINRLKDELAQQQTIIRKGVTAEELHPSVHNLPHDTVQTKYDVYPDMEVAE